MKRDELFWPADENNNTEHVAIANEPVNLLHDFKAAILVLTAISSVVYLLMHWFVPGM